MPSPPLVPALATSWEISPDGLSYTFKLRPGVKFHDGTPFDAAAVKFNFERFWDEKSPNFYQEGQVFRDRLYEVDQVASRCVDPMTVRVTLKAANYQWLRQGLQSYGQPLMVSPAAVKKYGNDGIALHPIGTGPFRFVEREQGVKTVIERNPDYWGTPAKLDRVIFRPLQDPATRVNALENGEIQMMTTPPWDDIQRLVDEGFKLSTNENVPYINFLYLNFEVRAVQGHAGAHRRSTWRSTGAGIVKEIYRNTGRAEYGMLSPGTDAYDANFQSYRLRSGRRQEAARRGRLRQRASRLIFQLPQYGTGEIVETWIQRDLKKIGIDVELQKFEWVTYMGKWAAGMPEDIGMNEIGWGMSTPAWIDIVSRCDSGRAERREFRLVLQPGGRQAARPSDPDARRGRRQGALPEGQPADHGRCGLCAVHRRSTAGAAVAEGAWLRQPAGGLVRLVDGDDRVKRMRVLLGAPRGGG